MANNFLEVMIRGQIGVRCAMCSIIALEPSLTLNASLNTLYYNATLTYQEPNVEQYNIGPLTKFSASIRRLR